jgi:L-lactate permease
MDKIKAICFSKSNILVVVATCFAFLRDTKDLIINFASNLILISISLVVLVALFILHYVFKSKNEEIIEKTAESEINHLNLSKEKSSIFKSFSLSKAIFSFILFIMMMTAGSLYYIKNLDIYYVVLQNNLNIKQAKVLQAESNNSEAFKMIGLSTRVIEMREVGQYELILYNGYLSEEKAKMDLVKVKTVLSSSEIKPYLVGPQRTPSLKKKIIYIQKHLFN